MKRHKCIHSWRGVTHTCYVWLVLTLLTAVVMVLAVWNVSELRNIVKKNSQESTK